MSIPRMTGEKGCSQKAVVAFSGVGWYLDTPPNKGRSS